MGEICGNIWYFIESVKTKLFNETFNYNIQTVRITYDKSLCNSVFVIGCYQIFLVPKVSILIKELISNPLCLL